MTHPGSLPSQCQDFKPSFVHTLQSARQRPSSAEIPPSDSWLDRHFSVPKGANLWFVRALFLKSVGCFGGEEEELVKDCTVLIHHVRRLQMGPLGAHSECETQKFCVSTLSEVLLDTFLVLCKCFMSSGMFS